MLVGLLGEDYGVYASSYIALLLIPAVFLGIIIGLLLYFGGIGIANHFMGELNDLAIL